MFLGVPSRGLDEVIAGLAAAGLGRRTPVVSLAKGLVPPDGLAPTTLLSNALGASRVACVGGPAHAREMVTEGAGLVAASVDAQLAATIAGVFMRAGVVCEQSSDPVGVELAGVAKNAAALAAGATEAQGLNAAGAAAGHIFLEVWRFAERQGARPESMIGLAGTGDLVATALAPQSRNRRAGELLAEGVPAAEIPERIGQAVEALDMVPLLAEALEAADIEAPVTHALQPPDRRRAAARRLGRPGARHRPAAGAVRQRRGVAALVVAAAHADALVTPRAVLFDLDGVLLDSRTAIVRCIQHGLRENGAPVPAAAELERFIGPPLIDAFAELAGADRVDACLAAYRERYVWSSLEETTVVPGAAEALAAVAAPRAGGRRDDQAARVRRAAVRAPRPGAVAARGRRARARRAGGGQDRHGPPRARGARAGARRRRPAGRRPQPRRRGRARQRDRAASGVLWGIGDEAELRAAGADPIVASPADLVGALGLERTAAG